MFEQNLTLSSSGETLAGTWLRSEPNQLTPVVLMIHGSGPLDRDANMPNQSLNIFNAIAKHLVKHGISSVRYDKRGCGDSSGDFSTTGHVDLVNDASAWVDFLHQTHDIAYQQIIVLGHSEGTLIAAQLAVKYPKLGGLILLAPFVQPMESILIQQAKMLTQAITKMKGLTGFFYRMMRFISGDPVKHQYKIIEKVKTSSDDTLRYQGKPLEAKWLKELLQLEPTTIYRQINCPTLLIGGEKDIQCDPKDIGIIANLIQGPTEPHLIKDLTHILRLDPAAPSLFHYPALMKQPIEPTALTLISNWIK